MELWHDYTFYSFIFLNSRRMSPEGLPFLLTPLSLRTPPLYFALQNTGEEGESNLPLIAVRCPAYGAQQGRSLEVALYSFAIFLFQPPLPLGTPPIFLVGTQGERLRCIPLSPLLRFYTEYPAMLRDTAGGEEAYPCHYRYRYYLTLPSLRATSSIFCWAKHPVMLLSLIHI